MTTETATIHIKEMLPDLKYEGYIEFANVPRLLFQFAVKMRGEQLDKLFEQAKTQEERQKLTEDNTSLKVMREDGSPTGLSPEQEFDLCFQPISFAYGFLIDSRKKGQGDERTFNIPLL